MKNFEKFVDEIAYNFEKAFNGKIKIFNIKDETLKTTYSVEIAIEVPYVDEIVECEFDVYGMVISCRGKFITIPSNAKMNVIDDDIGKIAFQLIYIANDKGIKYMDWREFKINTLFLKDVVSEYQDLIENL